MFNRFLDLKQQIDFRFNWQSTPAGQGLSESNKGRPMDANLRVKSRATPCVTKFDNLKVGNKKVQFFWHVIKRVYKRLWSIQGSALRVDSQWNPHNLGPKVVENNIEELINLVIFTKMQFLQFAVKVFQKFNLLWNDSSSLWLIIYDWIFTNLMMAFTVILVNTVKIIIR